MKRTSIRTYRTKTDRTCYGQVSADKIVRFVTKMDMKWTVSIPCPEFLHDIPHPTTCPKCLHNVLHLVGNVWNWTAPSPHCPRGLPTSWMSEICPKCPNRDWRSVYLHGFMNVQGVWNVYSRYIDVLIRGCIDLPLLQRLAGTAGNNVYYFKWLCVNIVIVERPLIKLHFRQKCKNKCF